MSFGGQFADNPAPLLLPNGQSAAGTLYGLAASKPAASYRNIGYLYVATDTGAAWLSIGSAWIALAGGGGGGGVSAVTASAPLASSGGASPNLSLTGIVPVANGGTGTATPSLVAGTNITITGSWPNQAIAASGGGGVSSVTASAPLASSGGTTPNITHNTSGVTPGSYTSANITVDADGHVTAASNGSGGGGGVTSLNAATGAVTISAGTGISVSTFGSTITVSASGGGGGSGTVTSVAMTGDGTVYNSTVTGSPITTSGTLAPSLKSQSANTVLAGPSTFGTAAPTFRSLVAADLPIMGASGMSHAAGAAPDPGVTAGTTRFLREDATWAVPSGGGTILQGVCDYRLTLTSGTPVTNTDVSNVATVYWTPYKGNNAALYTGSAWTVLQPGELSISLGAFTLPVDIFVDYNSGTPQLAAVQWSSSGMRASPLVMQNGVYVLSGTPTKRYVGSVTPSTIGQTTDSAQYRYVWNTYNRVRRHLMCKDATASWTYATNAYRQANNNTQNLVAVCAGLSEDSIEIELLVFSQQSTASAAAIITGIGLGSTSPMSAAFGCQQNFQTQNAPLQSECALRQIPVIGTSKYLWLENAALGTSVQIYGTQGNGRDSGLYGSWLA